MKAFILVALLVVFAVVVMADDDEEKRSWGWGHKKCRSDRDCRKGVCCRGRCRTRCVKKCKSEDDCNEGQCCLKYRSTYRYGKCSAYLQEGAKCYKKSYFGFGKRSCGCAEGLECEIKKGGFFFHHYRYGKCATTEGSGQGSGDMI